MSYENQYNVTIEEAKQLFEPQLLPTKSYSYYYDQGHILKINEPDIDIKSNFNKPKSEEWLLISAHCFKLAKHEYDKMINIHTSLSEDNKELEYNEWISNHYSLMFIFKKIAGYVLMWDKDELRKSKFVEFLEYLKIVVWMEDQTVSDKVVESGLNLIDNIFSSLKE